MCRIKPHSWNHVIISVPEDAIDFNTAETMTFAIHLESWSKSEICPCSGSCFMVWALSAVNNQVQEYINANNIPT